MEFWTIFTQTSWGIFLQLTFERQYQSDLNGIWRFLIGQDIRRTLLYLLFRKTPEVWGVLRMSGSDLRVVCQLSIQNSKISTRPIRTYLVNFNDVIVIETSQLYFIIFAFQFRPFWYLICEGCPTLIQFLVKNNFSSFHRIPL